MQTLSVAIVGAGATGGYLAGRLAGAQVRVTLVARETSLQMIRKDGITILDADGRRKNSRPALVVAPEEIEEQVDLVLLCVKTYDTQAALPVVSALLKETGRVLCLQNGVSSEGVLARRFGAHRVLSGVLYIASRRTGPGTIECSAPPRLRIGSFADPDPGAAAQAKAMFERAGIECEVESDMQRAKWQKFLFNCGLNPLTAITGQRLARLLEEPRTAEVFRELVEEAAQTALADGAPLAEDCVETTMNTAVRMISLPRWRRTWLAADPSS